MNRPTPGPPADLDGVLIDRLNGHLAELRERVAEGRLVLTPELQRALRRVLADLRETVARAEAGEDTTAANRTFWQKWQAFAPWRQID